MKKNNEEDEKSLWVASQVEETMNETPVEEIEPEEITEQEEMTEQEEPEQEEESIKKGDKITFIGEKSYSGLKLSDDIKNKNYIAREVSGDRVVLGRGTAVVAAVNARDCKKI